MEAAKEVFEIIYLLLPLILGSAVIAFVYFRFAPNFELALQPRWEGINRKYLIVRITALNIAAVRVKNPKICLTIVLFDENHPKKIGRLASVVQPKQIFQKQLNSKRRLKSTHQSLCSIPKEKIFWEMFYEVPEETTLAQMSVTAYIHLNPIQKHLARKRKPDWYQTVSLVSVRPESETH